MHFFLLTYYNSVSCQFMSEKGKVNEFVFTYFKIKLYYAHILFKDIMNLI